MSRKSDEKQAIDRRGFLRIAASGLLAIPAASLLRSAPAQAADLPHLTEDDPQAVALGYHHDYTAVDPTKFPARDPSVTQNCANCQLYTGAAGDEWGPCSIFPGKAVKAKGWCRTWVKKAG